MSRTLFAPLAFAVVALVAQPGAAAAQAKPQTPMENMEMGHADHAKMKPAAKPSAKAAFQADTIIKVNGLVCDFCARSLEKTFRGTKKVSAVSVDLTAKEIRLKFLPGQSIDEPTIRKLVKDAGYAVVTVQRTAA